MSELPGRLLRETLHAGMSGESPGCLDAETVARWADDTLSRKERAAVEAHAASCARCQSMLAAMARTAPPAVTRAWFRSPIVAWAVPLTAAVAALLIYVQVMPLSRPADRAFATSPPAPAASAANQTLAARDYAPDLRAPAQTTAGGSAPTSAEGFGASTIARPASGGGSLSGERPADSAERSAKPLGERPAGQAGLSAEARPDSTRAKAEARAKEAQADRSAPAAAKAMPSQAPAPAAVAELAAPATPQPPSPVASSPAPPTAAVRPAEAPRAAAPAVASPAAPPAAVAGGVTGGRIASRDDSPERGNAARLLALSARRPASTIVIPSSTASTRWRVISTVVQRSTDGGTTWEDTQPTGASAAPTAGASPSPLVCWLVGPQGLVLLSTDGRTWKRLVFPETVDLTSVLAMDDARATVTTADGRTLATSDRGVSWIRR
jgi:Putative zinc-finger